MWDIGTTIGTKKGQGTLTAFENKEAIFTLPDGETFRMPYDDVPVHIVKHRKGYKAVQSAKAAKTPKTPKTPKTTVISALSEDDLQAELDKAKAKLDAIKAQREALKGV